MCHKNLPTAKTVKDDEFYTRIEDVMCEVVKYKDHLKGKVVYCNCDNAESAFTWFFTTYFHVFGIKRLYCSGLAGFCLEYDGIRTKKHRIDGDFRSQDCREILTKSDIVITNPPFSLFREWLTVVGAKEFLVIGNKNAIACKELFPQIQSGRVMLGYSKPSLFYRPDGSLTDKLQGLCRWFTTLQVNDKPTWMPTCSYNGRFLQYDHYPAINVDSVKQIPADYKGLMGVPITFLDCMDYSTYEIVDLIYRYAVLDKSYGVKGSQLTEIDGQPKYSRLIIRKKHNSINTFNA